MEKEFWLERWEVNQIGFHRDDYNPNLTTNFSQLGLYPGDTILVPLCGKTLDLIWLKNQALNVIGVELSDIAVTDFFKENLLKFTVEDKGAFKKYTSDNITLYQGDIFDINKEELGVIDAIYDRAATVALPVDIRNRYLRKLTELSTRINILMVLFEYEQYLISGPPFSVEESYLRRQYSDFKVEKLKSNKFKKLAPKFAEVGATVREKVYLIRNNK